MKRWLIALLTIVILVAAVMVGVQIQEHPSQLLIAYQQWALEMPLWFALLALAAGLLGFHILIRLLGFVVGLPKRWRRWRQQRRERQAERCTVKGICQFIEGRWQAAEQHLLPAKAPVPRPLGNYLVAAYTAHQLAANDRRDAYLETAAQHYPQAKLAIGISQARLQISNQQWQAALNTLQPLYERTPHQSEVLRLLARVYQALPHWSALCLLLPALRRYNILSPAEWEALAQTAYQGLLHEAITNGSFTKVTAVWQETPKAWRQNAAVAGLYADYLNQQQQGAAAAHLLRNTLKQQWHPDLVRRYGLTQSENSAKQLAAAEEWLPEYPEDAELLLCLGRLAVQQRLWGKARHYFEASLKAKPTTEGYYELGYLLEQIDEKSSALTYYRKGLQLKE